nr:MAG TPA: hypothetical protein [Caudoviricetes sp.]
MILQSSQVRLECTMGNMLHCIGFSGSREENSYEFEHSCNQAF